jgi:hypothetical protein
LLHNYHKAANPLLLTRPGLDEVLDSLTRTKNTAPGPDGIPFAAWRAAPDLAGQALLGALDLLLTGVTPPAGFNHALLFLLPKKPTGLVTDTRPISITNTDNRILASVVAHAIMPAVLELIHPAQKGFLWGKNGADHTLDLNTYFYEGIRTKRARFIFFLDTAKAFDSIDHDWILSVLRKTNFPDWVRLFVKNALTDVTVSPYFGTETNTSITSKEASSRAALCPPSCLSCAMILSSLLWAAFQVSAPLHLRMT